MKDEILYKVTKAIAKNDALTVGANIELDTIGSELSEISVLLSQISQSEYKIKEYTFQYTQTSKWMHFAIDESNAFIDGSSYFLRDIGTGMMIMPINGMSNQCGIVYSKDGLIKEIQFNSSYAGTLHAFVRYK